MSDREDSGDEGFDEEVLEDLEDGEEEPGPGPAEDDEDGSESGSDDDPGGLPAPMREEELNDIDRRACSMGARTVHVTRPENRRTSFRLSVPELSRVISIRAGQIENGEAIFTEVGAETTPSAIAEKELREGKCPLSVHRTVGRTPAGEPIQEVLRVRELALPPQFDR